MGGLIIETHVRNSVKRKSETGIKHSFPNGPGTLNEWPVNIPKQCHFNGRKFASLH